MKKVDKLTDMTYNSIGEYLQPSGIRYFRHLKGLFGTVSPVMRLNRERRGIPAHCVHLSEGMQIRNFLRHQPECKDWECHDFDNMWVEVIENVIK